ncbi:stalk domain-containing protein [Paenibacillus motobuensis]|uniref:stalk domain-containing protein n=1 Tax=Paenibacillus TaxID=44249 RepID=UPI00203F82AB|nr:MULTISPECIES: stalk domain-containing protein [Paenibacillus]MCM3042470.1 stalk domain-containing protein [Paenibacillus lutimineralis]MCM3649574.1 stalk domain-containing protein [Paenibacillus motobuensis]
MKKKLLITLGIFLLSVSIATGAFAATKYSIVVNGNKINADIKVINGSTYVPLRVVSEALGAKVSLDNGTINITNPIQNSIPVQQPTPPAHEQTPPAPQAQASRSNPANIAEVVPFTSKGISEEYKGNLTVLKTIRGTEAWTMIYEANRFNDAPKDGYEYILASIKIDITSNLNADNAVSVSPLDFTLVSSSGVDYKNETVVVPDPNIRTKMYVGGSHTGWVSFLVKKDDPSPLIVYGRKYNGSAGLWFKTN